VDFLPLRFTKMSGAGNTFLVACPDPDLWRSILQQTQHSAREWARIVCDPVLGVKTDGFLILSKASAAGADYVWEFYNSDGSSAEMCGNAARCAARYCYEILEKKQKSHFVFQTGAGFVEAVMLGNGLVRVMMPETLWVQKEISIKTDKNIETFACVAFPI
jgi:diaminopimelate epimerase